MWAFLYEKVDNMYFLPLILLILIAVFAYSFYLRKASFLNGLLGLLTIFAIAGNLMFFSLITDSKILHLLFLIVFVFLAVVVTLIYALHAVLLIWNGIIVWRRESHNLANLLTLIIGIIMVLYPLFNYLLFKKLIPKPYNGILEHISEMGIFYILSLFVIFSLSVMICNYYRPKRNKDFIIVLGAGLLDGDRVSPLLASRIDRAIDFYKQQIHSGNVAPLIICSGGQGGDETVPEGVAMRQYVLSKHVAEKDVVAEDQSKNTIQNFSFSRKIVDKYQLNPDNGIYVSNNYHIYRANAYARNAGMKIDGIGSKTSGFFLPNALIREFIAIVLNHKLANFLVLVIIIAIAILARF
ncbi:YdcF family protein [Apilactobacillus bombintestini]|uniref:YdcF family protein n=2 Tax=Apilactobacillus bombintestini TaxID=2419772 RepID=A0A387AQE1_9LACO|nr:YdcF family protein [Apilactobacillus bombintestini]